jgi:hypothetical protein
MMRRLFSSAAMMLALVLAASPSPAQRLMLIETRPGPPNQRWDPDPTLPDLPKPPTAEEYEFILEYVSGLTASQIDPELPAIEIGHWLSAVVWPKVTGGPPPLPKWNLDFCRNRTSDAPAFAPEFCAEATLALSPTRTLTVIIAAAIPLQARDGVVRWVLTPPSVRRIRLTEDSTPGWGDAFDMPSLRYLGESLDLPITRWPKPDLQAAVESTHRRALPGDVVTFTIRIRNAGQADLERAEVNVVLWLCCPDAERQYLWFPRIPAGHTATITFAATMPVQASTVMVTAYPFDPAGQDATPDDNTALVWIAGAADPTRQTLARRRRSATPLVFGPRKIR